MAGETQGISATENKPPFGKPNGQGEKARQELTSIWNNPYSYVNPTCSKTSMVNFT